MAYIVAQAAFGLVGQHVINPVGFGMNAVVDSDFHTVASVEFGFHRHQFAVYSGKLCVFAQMAMDFEGKVECGGAFRQEHHAAFRGEHHDVVGVERAHHILNEAGVLGVECDVL